MNIYICFMNFIQNKSIHLKEAIFQGIFILIVFLFYSFDRNNPQIELYEGVFFLNYAFAASIINFYLIPKFIYNKKYIIFIVIFLLLIAAVILIEELILEQFFFPETRGEKFSNVLYTLIDILPPIIILAGFKLAWDVVSKQRQLDELKLMVQESEMQFLKTQINPHFLFNNLNNIYVHAIENSTKTPEIILALSSLLRYMLYECKAAYVSLNNEIEQLHNFINLGELQIEGRGTVTFKNHVSTNSYRIAPLILIVFIENAFKHSSSSSTDNILINIELKFIAEGKLIFLCENNFQSDSNTSNLSQGIGLINVKKRLDLIYTSSYDLHIKSTDNQYSVYLELQLNE